MSDITRHDQSVAATTPGGPRRTGRRDRRGMTTAEYAVGTVAAVTFAGVLISIFQNPTFRELIFQLIIWIIRLVSGYQG